MVVKFRGPVVGSMADRVLVGSEVFWSQGSRGGELEKRGW